MEYEGIEATRRFIELLDSDLNEAGACWRTFPDKDRGNGHNYTGTFQEVWPSLEADQKQRRGLFRVVNLGGHKNKDITTVAAWFVDGDGVPLPDEWHLPPTFICQRGDRWHAYWLAELGVDADTREYRRIQKRLAAHYGTDPVVCNLARVMRIPGTEHHKQFPHSPGYTLTDFEDPGRRYSPDQVEAGLPELPKSGRASAAKGGEYEGEPDQPENVRWALNWLKKRDPAIAKDHGGGGGDDWTYITACELFEFALTPEMVAELLHRPYLTPDEKWSLAIGRRPVPLSWNDRCLPPWNTGELEQKIENALEYGENAWGCKITGQKAIVQAFDDAEGGLAHV